MRATRGTHVTIVSRLLVLTDDRPTPTSLGHSLDHSPSPAAVVRDKIKTFAQASVGKQTEAGYPCPTFKIIILDEV